MRIKHFESFLNEAVGQDAYTTVINKPDVSLYGFVGKDAEQYLDVNNDMKIVWTLDIDEKSWGLKSFAPVIKEITGNFTLVTPKDDKDEEEEYPFSFNPYDDEWKEWKLKTELNDEFEFGHMITPTSIEIDFRSKEIEITF